MNTPYPPPKAYIWLPGPLYHAGLSYHDYSHTGSTVTHCDSKENTIQHPESLGWRSEVTPTPYLIMAPNVTPKDRI